MNAKIFFRLQYNNGQLSCVIQDNKEQMMQFAELLEKNKRHYPVAIFTVRLKESCQSERIYKLKQ